MAKKRKTELDIDPSAEEEEEEPEPEPEPAPPEPEPEEEPKPKKPLSKKQKIIIASVAAAVLLIAGITLFFVTGEEKPPKEEPKKEEKKKRPPPVKKEKYVPIVTIDLAPFTIPYKVDGEKRFWRIAFALHLSRKEAIPEIEQNLVIFRESIYMFLQQHTLKDFTDPERKEKALFELKRQLDRSIQAGRIEDILIIEFTLL